MNIHELPKIAIDGAVFAIDAKTKALIDQDNHANAMNIGKYRGSHEYFILYDKERRNLAEGHYRMPGDYDRLIRVRLPLHLGQLHAMPTDEEIKQINEKAQTNGMNFAMVDSALNERLSGRLPKIDVHGDQFTVDWRLKELRSDTTFAPLRFNDFDVSPDGDKYLFLYHKPSQSLVFLDSDITELPKDTFLVEVDNELVLDPVATAREYMLDDAAFYPNRPVILQHTAKVTPIEETYLVELVEQNRAQRDTDGRDEGIRQR